MHCSLHEVQSHHGVSKMETMPCKEKDRLFNLYKAAVTAHSAAVNDLSVTRETISKREYDRLWNLAEHTKAESELASLSFYQHTREHCC
jgi:hypothetical protein